LRGYRRIAVEEPMSEVAPEIAPTADDAPLERRALPIT
jgi:hypothetical protein